MQKQYIQMDVLLLQKSMQFLLALEDLKTLELIHILILE